MRKREGGPASTPREVPSKFSAVVAPEFGGSFDRTPSCLAPHLLRPPSLWHVLTVLVDSVCIRVTPHSRVTAYKHDNKLALVDDRGLTDRITVLLTVSLEGHDLEHTSAGEIWS